MAALGLFMVALGLLLLLGSFGALMYYIYQRGRKNPVNNANSAVAPAEPEANRQRWGCIMGGDNR